ncbi:MAG: sensor histidine kinase [Bdellovibrionales bacterium]
MTTTFIIIIAFSLINMLMSVTIYLTSKRDLYIRTGLFWLFLIANFLIQSQSQSDEFSIIMGYGFTIVPLNLLCLASLSFCNWPYPKKILISLSLLSIGLTFALKGASVSFMVKAMPFAAAAAAPLLFTVYIYLFKAKTKMTHLMYIHAFVLFLLAVHSFNFAFFRMVPAAQLWGWPVAYGLYQLLAVLIPALTLDLNHLEEQSRLQDIIDQKTQVLVSANKDLQKLVGQKEYLFRTLTHDISTPLMVIQNTLNGDGEGCVNKDDLLATISIMTDKMARLIQQVRQFDRIDKLAGDLNTQEVCLLDCLQDVESLFTDRLLSKNLFLVYDKEVMSVCRVRVELNSFVNSVLPNIISNSIKFSHPGQRIEVAVRGDGSGYVIVSVRDAGIGIPAEMLPKIFDFETNYSRNGTSGETGTGFGIPIMSKLINAYGGEIKITSEQETQDRPGFTLTELKLFGTLNDMEQKSA